MSTTVVTVVTAAQHLRVGDNHSGIIQMFHSAQHKKGWEEQIISTMYGKKKKKKVYALHILCKRIQH